MNDSLTVLRAFLAGALFAAVNAFGQATPPDRLAEIASTVRDQNAALVTPGPPKLAGKTFSGAHDPAAVFQPAEKLDTAEELAVALDAARRETARFLEDHAPAQ